MNRALILVIDGLGIGAMPDASTLRAGDADADTLGHILAAARDRSGRPPVLPTLAALGLGLTHPSLPTTPMTGVRATRAALGYPGADTFTGHQTMMGADMSAAAVAGFASHLGTVAAALRGAGHTVRTLPDLAVLHVDGAVIVGDNLEADPGLNWNASGRLDDVDFDHMLRIARTVRGVAPVARVIAVGGHSDRSLLEAVRAGDGGTAGLDTPASGFYRTGGLRVVHLGCTIDHERQLPTLATRAGLPVALVGKAADILECPDASRYPAVATDTVFTAARKAFTDHALTVVNVQETDLAGHQQDPHRYAALLARIDHGLAALTEDFTPDDLLLVTADHGNDPTIGHAYHTREYVPVLCYRPASGRAAAGATAPQAGSLADIGATIAAALDLDPAALHTGHPGFEPNT